MRFSVKSLYSTWQRKKVFFFKLGDARSELYWKHKNLVFYSLEYLSVLRIL